MTSDHVFMSRALQLAKRGDYTTRPNPRVGCVIVKDKKILVEGWHYRAGDAHAERHALSQLASTSDAQGATVYVTLEPCSHQGRTGPCAELLIDAGVSNVVYGMQDPNPQVSGRGLTVLEQAGINVIGPVLEEQAKALNSGFIQRMQKKLPWVRVKMACSLDGRTAMASGESQWITGKEARQDVQRWRAKSCAIIAGVESILQDNSRLTVRQSESGLDNIADILSVPPLRVILDSHLRTPVGAACLQADGKVVIFTSNKASQEAKEKLTKQWAGKLKIEVVSSDKFGLSLEEVLHSLAEDYQCNEILVETGATLSGSFLQAGLVNELIVYQAPVLLGSEARPLMQLPLSEMQEKVNLKMVDQRKFGNDQRLMFRIDSPA